MIISRESRKSRKIIHRYRSYVAVRMANASEMMRFRVICEIRVRQKAAWNGNIFIMRFPCNAQSPITVTAVAVSCHRGDWYTPPRWCYCATAVAYFFHRGDVLISIHSPGKTHYKIALKWCLNNLCPIGSSLANIWFHTDLTNLTEAASHKARSLSASPSVFSRMANASVTMRSLWDLWDLCEATNWLSERK